MIRFSISAHGLALSLCLWSAAALAWKKWPWQLLQTSGKAACFEEQECGVLSVCLCVIWGQGTGYECYPTLCTRCQNCVSESARRRRNVLIWGQPDYAQSQLAKSVPEVQPENCVHSWCRLNGYSTHTYTHTPSWMLSERWPEICVSVCQSRSTVQSAVHRYQHLLSLSDLIIHRAVTGVLRP